MKTVLKPKFIYKNIQIFINIQKFQFYYKSFISFSQEFRKNIFLAFSKLLIFKMGYFYPNFMSDIFLLFLVRVTEIN